MIQLTLLIIIVIIVSGTYSQQQCTTDNPVAFMCRNSTATGSNVTLDVSMAASLDTDSCTCTVTADLNGMYMVMEYPGDASNCSSQISVFFLDKSLMTQCGPPGLQETNGRTADVLYTRTRNSTDSSYCITFYSGTQDNSIRIVCSPANLSQETTTKTTALPVTTASSLPSNSSSSLTTMSTNVSIASSTATLPTNISTSSPLLFPNSTTSTTRSPFTTVSTTINTQMTTISNSSTSNSNSTHSVPLTSTPSYNSSSMTSGSTTVAQNSTMSANNTTLSSSTLPLNKTISTSTTVPINTTLETTFLTQNSTLPTNISTTSLNKTTTESTTLDPGSSKTTEMPTTTSDYLTTTTEYLATTDDPNNSDITTAVVKNATVRTTTSSINSTNIINSSSVAVTTVSVSNSSSTSTSAPDTSTDIPITTELNTATTSLDSTTNVGTTTTDFTDMTDDPDNVTAEYNTTAHPTKTTRNWDWDIPDPGDYSEDKKTNAMIIVLPLVAVILVFFLGAVTFVICKRSRKASRQTRLPKTNEKTVSKDKDKSSPPTFLAPNLVNEQVKGKDQKLAEHLGNGKLDHHEFPSVTAKDIKRDTSDKNESMPVVTRDKPNVYQPTEKEKNLLESLELSTIVVESDPSDPNRYFKKADPGDWYRVIMKGKDPKRDKDSKKKRKKNRDEDDNKHDKKRKGKKKHKHSSGESSEEKKRSRHKSDKHVSEDDSRNKDTKSEDGLNAIQSVQPRIIVSQPAAKTLTVNEDASVPKTTVVMSKPSPALEESRDTRTRTVFSKPSSETTPSANTRLSSGQVAIPKATNTTNSDKANVHSVSKEAVKQEIKRPDIVPPLDLTGTGDKVTRADDGFDSFVLVS